jgi:hypothetical protein
MHVEFDMEIMYPVHLFRLCDGHAIDQPPSRYEMLADLDGVAGRYK